MKLVKLNPDKELKPLYKFFVKLGNTPQPPFKEYVRLAKQGEAYAFVNENGKVIGGLVQYVEPKYIAIMNYYVPKATRGFGLSWKVYGIVANFQRQHPKKRIYAVSNDISEWKQFAKHIKDNLYEVMLPRV